MILEIYTEKEIYGTQILNLIFFLICPLSK